MARTFIPNSFQTPNDFIDWLMPLLTPEEFKVLMYAGRRIYGFPDRPAQEDRIALSQFAKGALRALGTSRDYGTGLTVDTCRKAVHALVTYRIMVQLAPNDPHVNAGPLYTLQRDSDHVDVAGLEARAAAAEAHATAQSQAARAARKGTPPDPLLSHNTPIVAQEGVVSHNTPPPIAPQYPPPYCGTVTQKTRETQGNTESAARAPDPLMLVPGDLAPDWEWVAAKVPQLSAEEVRLACEGFIAHMQAEHPPQQRTRAAWAAKLRKWLTDQVGYTARSRQAPARASPAPLPIAPASDQVELARRRAAREAVPPRS